jgi:hypothetical protein
MTKVLDGNPPGSGGLASRLEAKANFYELDIAVFKVCVPNSQLIKELYYTTSVFVWLTFQTKETIEISLGKLIGTSLIKKRKEVVICSRRVVKKRKV